MTRDPDLASLHAIAASVGLELDEGEAMAIQDAANGLVRAGERLAEHADLLRGRRKDDREATWTAPEPDENPSNGWRVRTRIQEVDDGPLTGLDVAIKDAIAVAGVPLSAGSHVLSDFVPKADATVVRRILQAGGRITGIGTTEDLCLSISSSTSADGQVTNPRDPARSAGGSSSGVAALTAEAACDVGIGTDQGGSVRIPAALCGVLGLKPTYGLVPYTGCVPVIPSCDHVGILARSTDVMARVLEAVAGDDEGRDPRQPWFRRTEDRWSTSAPPQRQLRVGLLEEGLGGPDPTIDRDVRASLEVLRAAGCLVTGISIPEHTMAADLHRVIAWHEASLHLLAGRAVGFSGKGHRQPHLATALGRGLEAHGNRLFTSGKFAAVGGTWFSRESHGYYYALAQNLALELRRAYDEALVACDVLVMPTAKMRAPAMLDDSLPQHEQWKAASPRALIENTCAANQTGHPALSIPIGDEAAGLPAGLMAVGRPYQEAVLLHVADLLDTSARLEHVG